ncbi:LysR family transcriptional regulator [Nocardioides eburneiflavus]|uniref:LysR family transcriptional regulator n=1 Tax=Nocardioides eburneiflavus TaxID=2518372 RepID=A0A4Z1C700_9ACTN|nr:LysR family transcriptional regulator [Nocardioides eburneiflavus]TGN65192.1 LysR family transcriptional regulator [Nocardioides eburneiflavus]
MGSYPEVDDLRLVDAVARHGSLGAAARELLITQPSASQRLAALERRCGVRLFDRDTTGARVTAAGREMVAEADHILGHLGRVFERSRAAAESETLTVGTIPSLAMLVFPALHVALPGLRISQLVDHGPRLVGYVAEGSLDAAFVAIAGQIELPKGVTGQAVGVDPIGVLVPSTCDLRSTDRRQLAGRTVVTYTTDYSGEDLDGRVAALGATPHRAATAETAVRLGRLLGAPVVLPRSLLRTYLLDSDRELATARFGGPRLSLVTRVPRASYWADAAPLVGRELGLPKAPSRA